MLKCFEMNKRHLSNVKGSAFQAHTHWADGPPTRILILRHGETDWNISKKIQGWRGTGLNATGLKQARAAARRLKVHWKIEGVVSSDLKRSMQTAEVAARAFRLPVVKEPLARERRFGDWEGKKISQVLERYKLSASQRRDPFLSFNPRGGESMAVFSRRMEKLLKTIEKNHAGKTVLLVTHGGPMRILACRATGIPWKSYYRLGRPSNAALSLIEVQGGVRWIDFYNDAAHLEHPSIKPKRRL